MLQGISSIILNAGKILAGLAWETPTLLLQKRRAIAVFKKELQLTGLDDYTIKELTKTYKQMGDMKDWIATKK